MSASGYLESLVDVEKSGRGVAHTFDSGLGCVELVLLLAPLCSFPMIVGAIGSEIILRHVSKSGERSTKERLW